MKQRIIISLEPRQLSVLKRLAKQRDDSVSSLVRRAVDTYIEGKEENPATSILEHMDIYKEKYKKAFKHVEPTLSQDIDKILYGAK